MDQQRYTDPSLTPDKPTGTSELGIPLYEYESNLSDINAGISSGSN